MLTRDRFQSDFDKESKTDEGYNSEEERARELDKLTKEEREMHEVLQSKKQEIVTRLIAKLSSRNLDLEQCLNAHGILMELADHETTFGKLVQKENLLALIRASCDFKNVFQHYALNVLITVIKEFPNYDRQVGTALAAEF